MNNYIIRKANLDDIHNISLVTKRAFSVYGQDIRTPSTLLALNESEEKIKDDILNHTVYVADDNGAILGSIRYRALSRDLAYIYRFGVDPDISSAGVGSDLLGTVVDECKALGFSAIALHTNSKYYKLARYYYGKQFFVHSTSTDRGYIRALFIKELESGKEYDISPAFML